MASCPQSALQTQACANLFNALATDSVESRAIELQLLYNTAGGSETIAELLAQACANWFNRVATDESISSAVELQLLCNITDGDGDGCVEPDAPTNFTLIGVSGATVDASWDAPANPTLNFLFEYGLVSGGPYTLSKTAPAVARTWGFTSVGAAGTYFGTIRARTTTTCFSEPSNEITFTIS